MFFVYSVIKILPLKKWFPVVAWRDIERVLLVVGVLGAFAALLTGETAEHLVRPNRQLVETHAFFASVSAWIYSGLLVGEIAACCNTKQYFQTAHLFISKLSLFLEKFLCHKSFSIILAIIGFLSILITGMLGGIMVYGVTADPFAPILLKLLQIRL